MAELSDLSTIKNLLAKHGFSFSHSLGQNFLINASVCPKMAALCGADKNSAVIEIGAGIGVLTKELAKTAGKVISFELDKRLLPVLGETLRELDNVQIINADIMKTDLKRLIAEKLSGMKVYVCANLPYYITTPIITKLLEERLPVESITVMIQKEVAERLASAVGSRNSSAVTVCINYYAEVEKLFSVSRGSFHPSPNVDSAVIKLSVRKEPAVFLNDEKAFFSMVKAAFSQRRKTLANALSGGLALSKEQAAQAIENAGLAPGVRAEMLTMQQLAAVSEEILRLYRREL